jgi:uncharacterized protein (TIGR02284 family)
MFSKRKEVIATLNELIQACNDGQERFRLAVDTVKDKELKAVFRFYGKQRARLMEELQVEVCRLRSKPANGGSAVGTLHRGWMKLKNTIATGDGAALIAECKRGEEHSEKQYEGALEKRLPEEVRRLIHRQYAAIKLAHDRINALEVKRKPK